MPFYNWDEVEARRVEEKVTRQVISGDKAMVVLYGLRAGFVMPPHTHENEQIVYTLSGAMRLRVGDEERVLRAGDVAVVPSNVEHGAETLEDTVNIAIFSPTREEWL